MPCKFTRCTPVSESVIAIVRIRELSDPPERIFPVTRRSDFAPALVFSSASSTSLLGYSRGGGRARSLYAIPPSPPPPPRFER